MGSSLQWLSYLFQIVVFIVAAAALPFMPDGHWGQLAVASICLLALLAIVSAMIAFIVEQKDQPGLDAIERHDWHGGPVARTSRGWPWLWIALQIGIAVVVWLSFAPYDPHGEIAPDARDARCDESRLDDGERTRDCWVLVPHSDRREIWNASRAGSRPTLHVSRTQAQTRL